MFLDDESGSYFCGFTFWPAPRHCAGAVRYSFCMSPAWVSAPAGARFSIGRSVCFPWKIVCCFLSLFTVWTNLCTAVSLLTYFHKYQTQYYDFVCLNLVFLTTTLICEMWFCFSCVCSLPLYLYVFQVFSTATVLNLILSCVYVHWPVAV